MTTYNYNGYRPYGAAQMFIIDTHTAEKGSFDGNATEEAVRLGYQFIENGNTATLKINDMDVEFVKVEQ